MNLPPPPAPPGPGVHPPFPAPPVEGRGRRAWTSFGITAGVVALVCGGGAVAGLGLVTAFSRSLDEQAGVVVGHYLDDLRERDYAGAYQQLCEASKQRESQADYTARMAEEERALDLPEEVSTALHDRMARLGGLLRGELMSEDDRDRLETVRKPTIAFVGRPSLVPIDSGRAKKAR